MISLPNRFLITSREEPEISERIHLLFIDSAARAVVPEPAKKSAMISFSSLADDMIRLRSAIGF